MEDIDYSELEDAVLTLEDEDGNSIDCTMQCIFEYNGQDYAAVMEEDNPENEVYFFELNATKKKNEIEFEFTIVEEEDLLDELLEIFQQIANAEFEDETSDNVAYDIDDEEDDDDDEDDSIWDEFITKKLGD